MQVGDEGGVMLRGAATEEARLSLDVALQAVKRMLTYADVC
jgi:hypothetical protein